MDELLLVALGFFFLLAIAALPGVLAWLYARRLERRVGDLER